MSPYDRSSFKVCLLTSLLVWVVRDYKVHAWCVSESIRNKHAGDTFALFSSSHDDDDDGVSWGNGRHLTTTRLSSSTTRPVAITEPSPNHLRDANEIAKLYQVKPSSRLPKVIWRYSWRLLHKLLPLLHAFDSAKAKDMDKSLRCLWCKAIASQDRTSPVYDDGMTYDMLPSKTRWILLLPNRLFPRLIHFNIELRTAYLDLSLRQILIERASPITNTKQKVRLITLGAGYDVRSVRLLTEGIVDEAWEFDIQPVSESKRTMLQRLQQRRCDPKCKLPHLIPIDLNDLDGFQQTLERIASHDISSGNDIYTIFLSEGVLIYLNEGVPSQLLSICSDHARSRKQDGIFLFTDLIRNVPLDDDQARDKEHAAAKIELQNCGWELIDSSWFIKPGWARHMGTANLGFAKKK